MMNTTDVRILATIAALIQGGLAWYMWKSRPHWAGYLLGGTMASATYAVFPETFPVVQPTKPTTPPRTSGPESFDLTS